MTKSGKKRKVWILGEGHLWAMGISNYKQIGLCKKPIGTDFIEIKFPKVFWKIDNPKIRLIAEEL